MTEVKPWMEPDFPSTLCEKYLMGYPDFMPIDVIVRFPIPLFGTIMHYTDVRNTQIKEMIENNIKLKDFVLEWPEENKLNALPYTIILYMYGVKSEAFEEPHNFYDEKIGVKIEYNRKKYIEMAKYPLNEDELSKEYIRVNEIIKHNLNRNKNDR